MLKRFFRILRYPFKFSIQVVLTLRAKDSKCIERSQASFTPEVAQNVAYIDSNFGMIAPAIKKLETQGLTII